MNQISETGERQIALEKTPRIFLLQYTKTAMVSSSSTCPRVVVAYAFLTRDRLPLWPVWQRYLAGCPEGSGIPLVHAQDTAGSAAELERAVAEFGGRLLPSNETMLGAMRFSWNMVAAMMALFRAAGHAKKALGPSTVCPPNFVQVLSERCAPVTQCAVVHSRLAERMGTSLLDVSQHEIDQQGVPRAIAPLRKASQWMTLWVEHALALAYAEQSMHHKWVPNYYRNEHGEWGAAELRDEWGELEVYGAIDEFLWVPEMTQRGLKFERGGLTHVRRPRYLPTYM